MLDSNGATTIWNSWIDFELNWVDYQADLTDNFLSIRLKANSSWGAGAEMSTFYTKEGGYLSKLIIEADPSNPIPEPATMLLLGTGLIGLAGFRRKWATRGRSS